LLHEIFHTAAYFLTDAQLANAVHDPGSTAQQAHINFSKAINAKCTPKKK